MNLAELQHATPSEIATHLAHASNLSTDEIAASLIGLAKRVEALDHAMDAAAVVLTSPSRGARRIVG